jgi:hypothetical protein
MFFGSYPTYEEWKLYINFLLLLSLSFRVLILPMRNGNNINSTGSSNIYHTYLCSYPTYEEWKYKDSKYRQIFLRSYPTYEEWKNFHFPHAAICLCSYPTYEEWNVSKFNEPVKKFLSGSYPTYEEWKRCL